MQSEGSFSLRILIKSKTLNLSPLLRENFTGQLLRKTEIVKNIQQNATFYDLLTVQSICRRGNEDI